MSPAITCVALDLTTQCDRRCPACCAGIGINRVLQHHDWEYFERAARVIYGVERVHLSGGEPTFHPQFEEFVPRFKDLFGCKRLSMVTDGWGVHQHYVTIACCIDEVHFTRYGNRRGTEEYLKWMESSGAIKLSIFDAGQSMANFTPRSKIGGGKPCHRHWQQSGQVAYADGKLWGCCVAPGIDRAEALVPIPPLPTDWSPTEIPDPPCERCWFSE